MCSLALERGKGSGAGRMDFYSPVPNNTVSMSQSGIE